MDEKRYYQLIDESDKMQKLGFDDYDEYVDFMIHEKEEQELRDFECRALEEEYNLWG